QSGPSASPALGIGRAGRPTDMCGRGEGDSRSETEPGPLRPVEFAHAAVTAALMSAIAVLSMVVPGAVVFAWAGAVPMGVLAFHHRARVAVATTMA
ncbi:hypothetical protein PJI74_29415, partial [Mycobacterium kansasii]